MRYERERRNGCSDWLTRRAHCYAAWPSARLTIGLVNARPGAAVRSPIIRRRCRWLGLPRSRETRRAAMAQTMTFWIGADASCTDGACGQVSRLSSTRSPGGYYLAVDPKQATGAGATDRRGSCRELRAGLARLSDNFGVIKKIKKGHHVEQHYEFPGRPIHLACGAVSAFISGWVVHIMAGSCPELIRKGSPVRSHFHP